MAKDNPQGGPLACREQHRHDSLIFHDPVVVKVLYHPTKQRILRHLLAREMKIIDLKKALKMNPGTIKRHIDDLCACGLIERSRVNTNQYGIKEKYYRATANHFVVHLEWPAESDFHQQEQFSEKMQK